MTTLARLRKDVELLSDDVASVTGVNELIVIWCDRTQSEDETIAVWEQQRGRKVPTRANVILFGFGKL